MSVHAGTTAATSESEAEVAAEQSDQDSALLLAGADSADGETSRASGMSGQQARAAQPAPPLRREPLAERLVRAARRFGPALGVYALAKAVGFISFAALFTYAAHRGSLQPVGGHVPPHSFLRDLAWWDGVWYKNIAEHGYHPRPLPSGALHGGPLRVTSAASVAFFPLYPALMRLVATCTGLPVGVAGLVVAVVSSLVAAAGILALGERVVGRRAALVACALWAVIPGSGVEWAVYSDATFTALALWTLYCAVRRRWLWATALCFLAGLERPTSFALIGALALAAAHAAWQRRDGWRPYPALLIPCLGFFGYLGWVGYRLGTPTGYFILQRAGWGHSFDGGWSTLRSVLAVMTAQVPRGYLVADLVSLALLAALPCLLMLMPCIRPPFVVTAFTLITVVAVLGSQQLFSNIPRYLVPVVPLLYPVAYGLRRLPWTTLGPLFLVVAAASGWFAGFVTFNLGVP